MNYNKFLITIISLAKGNTLLYYPFIKVLSVQKKIADQFYLINIVAKILEKIKHANTLIFLQ